MHMSEEFVLDKEHVEEAVWQLFHEWKRPLAKRLLKIAEISQRNWTMYMQRSKQADGHVWTYEQLANEYNCSRPRAYQIVTRTEEKFWKFCERIGLKSWFNEQRKDLAISVFHK